MRNQPNTLTPEISDRYLCCSKIGRCHSFEMNIGGAASAIAIPAEDDAAVSTGTGRSAAAASAVERMADAAVATVTSEDAASALAVVVTPNVEYAAAGGTDTSAATASGQENLAVGASTAVGMMSATEKVAMPAGRVDDTGSNTSAIGAKGNSILL